MIAVIAVLAGAGIALLAGGHAEAAAEEAARHLAADLAYAQADALAKGSARSVVFEVDAERYEIQATDNGAILTHPVSKRPFEVDLAGLFPGISLDLVSADFSGATTLTFAPNGTPQAGGTVTVGAARHRFRVSVADGTGRVEIEALAAAGSDPEDPVAD